jgi:hypothetical protein
MWYNTNGIIDAVPKKRGPKTDVLEALLKRVDGLEKRLKDENKAHLPDDDPDSVEKEENVNRDTKLERPQIDTGNIGEESTTSRRSEILS